MEVNKPQSLAANSSELLTQQASCTVEHQDSKYHKLHHSPVFLAPLKNIEYTYKTLKLHATGVAQQKKLAKIT